MNTAAKVNAFIAQEFATDIPSHELDGDLDLVENGIVDSLGLLTIIAWIEDLLAIEIDPGAIDTADLRSVSSICALIESHRAAAGAADGETGHIDHFTPAA